MKRLKHLAFGIYLLPFSFLAAYLHTERGTALGYAMAVAAPLIPLLVVKNRWMMTLLIGDTVSLLTSWLCLSACSVLKVSEWGLQTKPLTVPAFLAFSAVCVFALQFILVSLYRLWKIVFR